MSSSIGLGGVGTTCEVGSTIRIVAVGDWDSSQSGIDEGGARWYSCPGCVLRGLVGREKWYLVNFP